MYSTRVRYLSVAPLPPSPPPPPPFFGLTVLLFFFASQRPLVHLHRRTLPWKSTNVRKDPSVLGSTSKFDTYVLWDTSARVSLQSYSVKRAASGASQRWSVGVSKIIWLFPHPRAHRFFQTSTRDSSNSRKGECRGWTVSGNGPGTFAKPLAGYSCGTDV